MVSLDRCLRIVNVGLKWEGVGYDRDMDTVTDTSLAMAKVP